MRAFAAARARLVLCCVFPGLCWMTGCSDEGPELKQPAKPPAAESASPSEHSPKAKPEAPTEVAAGGPGMTVEGEKPTRPPREGTVWATGTVNNLGARRRVPREGDAEVCVFEQGDLPCVKTIGQSGSFAIEVPQFAEVALLMRGDKLVPTLRAFVTKDQPVSLGNSRVANEMGLSGIAEVFGDKLDDKRGDLFFGGLPGVVATTVPPSGKRFYINNTGGLVEGATSVPMHGSGGFYNVKPGTVGLRFTYAGGACRYSTDNTFSGWPDPEHPNVARVPVRPGHHTHMVSMFCEKGKAAQAPADKGATTKKK